MNIITLIQAQNSGMIKKIQGNDSNIGMTALIENIDSEPLYVKSELGTVIGTDDPKVQKMIVFREKVYEIAPKQIERVVLDAICMEAEKNPPSASGGEKHSIEGIVESEEIIKLLSTLHDIESEISKNISSVEGDRLSLNHHMDDDLIMLTQQSRLSENEGGGYTAEISDSVAQCGLWQETDKVDFKKYAKVLGLDSPLKESKGTKESVKMLTNVAKQAEIILIRAEIEPTIKVPGDELGVLEETHDILGSKIQKLRRSIIRAEGALKTELEEKLEEAQQELIEIEKEIEACN